MMPRVFDPGFFGIERSADPIFVQLALVECRMLEQKRDFHELTAKPGLRREDGVINLIGTGKDDWSFGNGDASLAKA